MGDFDNINWEAANYKMSPQPFQKKKPTIDREVSKIVGKTVFVNDQRLIKLAIKWRGNKQVTASEKADNHLKDPAKIKELKAILG